MTRLSLVFTAILASPIAAQVVDSSVCASRSAAATKLPATIQIDVHNNHVFVKVCVGERPLDLILDTGAGETYLDLRTAERLGIKLGDRFEVAGAGAGTSAGAQLEGASVRLAGSSLVQPVPSSLDISRMARREGHRADGILGADFISRFVVAIDYAKQQLRLYDPRTYRYAGPGASIPITFDQNRFPIVDAAVKLADGETLKGRMLVDVGSGAALLLTKSFADENRLRDRVGPTIRRGGGGVGGAVFSDAGRVASLKLGAAQVSRPITLLAGAAGVTGGGGADWVGNIGGEILRRFTVYLDYSNKRIILEPHARTDEPFEADMSGIGLIMDDSLTMAWIDRVAPGSAAADAGLVAGDTLVRVDGRPATAAAIRELRKRFRRDGERIVLVVRRRGNEKTVTLVLRRLV
jgi:predicted aspartyl protease